MAIRDIDPSNEAWATIRAGNGNTVDDSLSSEVAAGYSVATGGSNYRTLYRGIYIFDTSSLPDTDTVTAATLSFYGSTKTNANAATPDINVYGNSKTDSDTALANAHFENAGSTAYSDTAVSYAGWSTSGYNDFALNATGIASISATGRSRFTTRNANYDVSGSSPSTSGGSQSFSYLSAITAETAGTTQDPKLVVTHTAPVGTPPPAAAFGGIQNLTYTYDAVGNITQIVDNSNSSTSKTVYFGYDDLYRLAWASTTNATTSTRDYYLG